MGPVGANDTHIGGENDNHAATVPIRIVAIGASAGGLDPFERFFDAMPADSGLAFVVIQHLSPNFKSMMDELLARHSEMAIHRIEEGTKIEANAIYLNQPRLVPTVENGVFKITDTSKSVDPNLPINAFFESLAADKGRQAIGVILSGTGSDGTKGCEAIKNAGGTLFVQEPSSAKFDGMPNSVINKELADVIAPPDILSDLVLRHARGEHIDSLLGGGRAPKSPIEYIFSLLVERFGTDFRCYKSATIERRIRRRYEMCGLNNFQDYADLVAADREEISTLYNDLLIDVTAFFRDGEAFELLNKRVIAELGERMSEANQVRIWVPACSSGEEPYSIAMLLADYAHANGTTLNVKILATDIHHRSLDAASAGIYPEASMKSISSDRVGRYFDKQGSYYHIRPEIRRLVVFTPHSLFRDPPFTRMDLVSCRNMLIYFKEAAQNKAMALFHFALNKNGYLFLGPSETLGKIGHEFETIDQRWRLFRKTRDIRLIESTTVLRSEDRATVSPSHTPIGSVSRTGMRDIQVSRPETRRAFNDALQTLLAQYAPAGFLTNRAGDLVHTFGAAGKFISVPEGGFSQRIGDLIHEDLKLAVSAGLERIKTHAAVPFHRRARFKDPDGLAYGVTLSIECLPDSTGTVDFLLITIKQDEEVAAAVPPVTADYLLDEEATGILRERVRELERDLTSTEESLQTTIEELETSNEELQATNEELMASNEELQSTNEELHSVNEELYTVSAEHQRKIEELTDLSNDMDQLLKSTEIGTIFLDQDLRIRRFTPAATNTFNLIAQDISRPFTHITHKFQEDVLADMLDEVMNTGEVVEHEVAVSGHHYLLRILPYSPMRDGPMEFVITIIDINELREANNAVTQMADFYQGILSDIAEYVMRWRVADGVVTYCNDAYADLVGKPAGEIIGSQVDDLFPDPEERKALQEAWATMAPGENASMRVRQETRGGKSIYREGSVRALGDENGNVVELQSTSRDATQDIKYLESLEALIDTTQAADDNYVRRIDEFLQTGAEFFGLEHALLQSFDGEELKIENYYGPATDKYILGKTTKKAQSMCHAALESGGVIEVHDFNRSKFAKNKELASAGLKAYVGAPLYKDSKVFGSVCFFSDHEARSEPFSASDISFMLLLARWIGYKIERRAQLQTLQRNEREMKFIFDSVPARIWYKDDKNIMLRMNQTAATSMGLTAEQAQGTDTYDVFPEMAKDYHDDDLAVLKSGKPSTGVVKEYVPLDGERSWISTDKIPFVNDETGERNLLVVSTDVTSLKIQEIALQELNDELEQANEGLRQFAYVASHDMQEPLRKIQQFSELLKDSYKVELDEEGQYFLTVVADSASRMSSLVRDLLTYSRTAHRELERGDVDLNDLVSAIKEELILSIEEADAKVSRTKLPSVAGDTLMMQQLFSNLISNAIKYREQGRDPVVKVSSKKTKQGTTITVADNGMGMDPKYISRIFEPFTRLQNDEHLKGTGIGLAICKSVCDRHGWEISAESEPGVGSKFTIHIPPSA